MASHSHRPSPESVSACYGPYMAPSVTWSSFATTLSRHALHCTPHFGWQQILIYNSTALG
eukprot:6191925-Pleurochrysis_carterae.AAC.4